MEVRLMGDVEIRDAARAYPLLRAGERCVLASLALEPNRQIHAGTLIDRLWGEKPPTGAGHTIASYVRTVRKVIAEAGGGRDWLRTHRPGGYELDIDPGVVDYHRFTALVAGAQASERDGKPADAVARYREAVALRTGEVLGTVTGQWAANRRYAIEQEYLSAVCALYQQQLTIGEHAAVAAHATSLVMEVVPTDRMILLAVHALARSGQHAAIPGFLTRAVQRMWETAEAQPSPEVLAVARRLIADPRPPPPPDPAYEPPARQANDDGAVPVEPRRASGRVTMIAMHNQQVHQAGGDQYIVGP